MSNVYMDILFALYVKDGKGSLAWLMEYLGGDSPSQEKHRQDIRASIGRLVSAKLVKMYVQDGSVHVSLTQGGSKAAVIAAGIIEDQMVRPWTQMGAVAAG